MSRGVPELPADWYVARMRTWECIAVGRVRAGEDLPRSVTRWEPFALTVQAETHSEALTLADVAAQGAAVVSCMPVEGGAA